MYTTGAVQVAAIPSKYVDNSTVTATEADVLSGKKFGSTNSVKTGSMANNGAVSKTLDGVATKSVTIPAGYTSGGTVSMDSTVDNAVTAALSALVEKGVEVPEGTNVTGLAALIAAIEAGGAKVATGTVTPSSVVSSLTITHSLGVTPIIVILMLQSQGKNTSLSNLYTAYTVFFVITDANTETSCEYSGGKPHIRTDNYTGMYLTNKDGANFTYNANEETVSFGRTYDSSKFLAETYKWMVIG